MSEVSVFVIATLVVIFNVIEVYASDNALFGNPAGTVGEDGESIDASIGIDLD